MAKFCQITNVENDNFYKEKHGEIVFENDTHYLIEFNFNKKFYGGVHKVMFAKEQVKLTGEIETGDEEYNEED